MKRDEAIKWLNKNRQQAIEMVDDVPFIKEHPNIGLLWKAWLEDLPSAEPTLYGYPVEHLAMIAYVLQKENFPPERIAEILSDIGLIVEMVRCEFEETLRDEFEETLRKVTERRTDERSDKQTGCN